MSHGIKTNPPIQAPYLMRECPPHNLTKSLSAVVSDIRCSRSYVAVPYNDRRLLVERGGDDFTALGSLASPRQNYVTKFQVLFQFHALDYGMENGSLALRIPEYGSETIVIARVDSTIDVLSLAVGALRRLSYRTLARRIDTTTG
jgi:hypothetical protein